MPGIILRAESRGMNKIDNALAFIELIVYGEENKKNTQWLSTGCRVFKSYQCLGCLPSPFYQDIYI